MVAQKLMSDTGALSTAQAASGGSSSSSGGNALMTTISSDPQPLMPSAPVSLIRAAKRTHSALEATSELSESKSHQADPIDGKNMEF